MVTPSSGPGPDASLGFVIANIPWTSFGAVEVGMAISMVFFGVSTLQTWNYYRDFPKDSLFVKGLVTIVYVADLVHSILFLQTTYHFTIISISSVISTQNPLALTTLPWALSASVLVGGLVVFVVQSYFCLRVYRLTESRILSSLCWLLALIRMGINIALTVTTVRDASIDVANTSVFKWQTIAELSLGMFSDVCIAMCICFSLLQRRTGFERSDQLVDRLVMYTIGSGAVTSIVSVAELITYVTMPTTFVWIAFFAVSSKLFSNSFLASLNRRGGRQFAKSISGPHSITTGSTCVNLQKEVNSTASVELATFSKPRTINIIVQQETNSQVV